MNNSLRDEIKKIATFVMEWTDGTREVHELPDERVDQILNLIESKMPEYKPISKNLVDSPEVEQWNNEAFAFNQAITEVKSILRGTE